MKPTSSISQFPVRSISNLSLHFISLKLVSRRNNVVSVSPTKTAIHAIEDRASIKRHSPSTREQYPRRSNDRATPQKQNITLLLNGRIQIIYLDSCYAMKHARNIQTYIFMFYKICFFKAPMKIRFHTVTATTQD